MKHLTSPFWLAALAGISLVTPAFAVVNIDYVPVGNAGNAADPATGYGAVAYAYMIAKNETSLAQYVEFLNFAAKTDTYGLYNINMTHANVAGIQRIGTSGSYSYTVMGSGNRPIAHVSWFDAARFCNWLHNGQGGGSTETGVYNLSGATSGIFTAQSGATVWIPSESEWYKAAYYDPTKNAGTGGYWLHANKSDTMTSNDITVAGAANYYDGDYAVTQSSYSTSQNYLTAGGAYGADSESYYGTNDQAGSLWELNDAVISGSWRGARGGGWTGSAEGSLRSTARGYEIPTAQYNSLGFRVASIPEPSSLVLTMFASSAILLRRKRD